MVNWNKYPNFSKDEFDCKETGENKMHPALLDTLQDIRTMLNKPMIITSGFRSIRHSLERNKTHPGEHSLGLAADILVQGEDALNLVRVALANGIDRIGVNQKGNSRYIHLGMADKFFDRFPKFIWSY